MKRRIVIELYSRTALVSSTQVTTMARYRVLMLHYDNDAENVTHSDILCIVQCFYDLRRGHIAGAFAQLVILPFQYNLFHRLALRIIGTVLMVLQIRFKPRSHASHGTCSEGSISQGYYYELVLFLFSSQ